MKKLPSKYYCLYQFDNSPALQLLERAVTSDRLLVTVDKSVRFIAVRAKRYGLWKLADFCDELRKRYEHLAYESPQVVFGGGLEKLERKFGSNSIKGWEARSKDAS